VLRMTWKVSACCKRMHSLGMNGEIIKGGNWLTQVHLEKWLLKRCVCVDSNLLSLWLQLGYLNSQKFFTVSIASVMNNPVFQHANNKYAKLL